MTQVVQLTVSDTRPSSKPGQDMPALQQGETHLPLRRLILPSIMTVVMLGLLLALGTWQVERLRWKLGILAQIAQAEAGTPVPLGSTPDPWAKVVVTGEFRNDLAVLYGADVRDTNAGPVMGSELVVPLIRAGGPPLLVDRGWVPVARGEPLNQPNGTVTVIGYVHPANKPGLFSVSDDLAGRQFFTLDPAAIGRALDLQEVAPFALVAIDTAWRGGWPAPAQHLPQPPNNHLAYAITWYGLAAALVVIFSLWVRKTIRP